MLFTGPYTGTIVKCEYFVTMFAKVKQTGSFEYTNSTSDYQPKNIKWCMQINHLYIMLFCVYVNMYAHSFVAWFCRKTASVTLKIPQDLWQCKSARKITKWLVHCTKRVIRVTWIVNMYSSVYQGHNSYHERG